MSEACENCRFGLAVERGKELTGHPFYNFKCRRHAPKEAHFRGWPETIPGDWCGEYQPKQKEDEDGK